MDFKKIAGGITASINRAVQLTEEKLGQTERTQYDAEFEALLLLADRSEKWTERMAKASEAVMQPNPAYRVEDFFSGKLEAAGHRRRERPSPLEELGSALVAASSEIGGIGVDEGGGGGIKFTAQTSSDGAAATARYAKSLALAGHAELRLAQLEADFLASCGSAFVAPLRAHLAGDARSLRKERRSLEIFRLDLDWARTRLRRCGDDEAARRAAEQECDKMEAEFEHQLRVTRLLLEGVNATHDYHLNCLNELVAAQLNYHSECLNRLQQLQRQMADKTE
ncbi:hypothetical protein BOX15_Mlig013634g1 [Macrostomum lignano]|uniref:BAR domain-containing protein n=2 Tax=Macrostomum lignano TaxID=282301 RepID=A0A267GL93_9PLAT|nr:hypothetical protein BOX15_Mlig013634g1 [Macrostomum lignano]